jgi:hypothetical protein
LIINNERVNQLIRLGESDATFSLRPRIEDIVDEHGRLKQIGTRVPLLDAIRALIARAKNLFPGLVHASADSGFSVDKVSWEAVIISLERVAPAQGDLVDPTPECVDSEIRNARGAYDVAVKILGASAKEDFSMDRFVELRDESPHRELTDQMLFQAGDENVGWITGDGKLPPLKQAMPPTLCPTRDLEVCGRIYDVDERNGIAVLEISDYRDAYAESMLVHHTAQIPLSFDKNSTERDDLLVIQYHQKSVWLRASATCAVSARHARKTSLALSRILMRRSALDQWHVTARQIPLSFDDR